MTSIDKRRSLEILRKMIAYPHPQDEMEKVRGFIAEIVKPIIEEMPFDDLTMDERGNLIAKKTGESSEPPFVVCTYAGSYPAENMPDAYTPKIVDGKEYGLDGEYMWGRSTTEQLSGGAAMLESLLTFFESPPELCRDLIFVTNYSGEMGNHEAVDYIFKEQQVPMGPTILATASRNTICLGNLGRIDIGITIEGVSCHSSDPSKGVNSIEGLRKILEKIHDFPYLEEDPDIGRATLTPTTIRTWPDALHTVPAFTRLVLDRRLIPGEEPREALLQFKEYLGDPSPELNVSFDKHLNFQYPHKADPSSELVRAAKKACKNVFGEERVTYKRSALDMGFFSHNDVDCITFGPGDYSLAHSDNEMISIADYHDAAQFYYILLERMLLKE